MCVSPTLSSCLSLQLSFHEFTLVIDILGVEYDDVRSTQYPIDAEKAVRPVLVTW